MVDFEIAILKLLLAIFFICGFVSPQYSSQWRPSRLLDRTANDPDLVETPFGVPVDFSYNETWEFYNWPWNLNSVPGCPKSIDGHPWVYYGNPRRCYLAGSRGPCDANSVLLLEMFSPYGVCACDCLRNRFDYGDDQVLSSDGKYMFCSPHSYKPLVYDRQRKKCFNLNDRGPCGLNDWLVKDPKSQVVGCVPRCGPPYAYDWWDFRCRKGFDKPPSSSSSNIPESPSSSEPGWTGPASIQKSRCRYNEWYSPVLRTCLKTSRGPYPGLIIA